MKRENESVSNLGIETDTQKFVDTEKKDNFIEKIKKKLKGERSPDFYTLEKFKSLNNKLLSLKEVLHRDFYTKTEKLVDRGEVDFKNRKREKLETEIAKLEKQIDKFMQFAPEEIKHQIQMDEIIKREEYLAQIRQNIEDF